MKYKTYTIVCMLLISLTACSNTADPKEHLGEIYSIAYDSIMENDSVLSSDISYIALDMSHLAQITEQDKKEILTYFQEKYHVEVMEATFEELEKEGLFNEETMSLDGVLLRIDRVDFKWFNDIFFEGSKYRAAKGAIGVEGTVHFKDGRWKIKEAKETWVS